MSTIDKLYEAVPGTIQYRVLEHLKALPPGVELSTAVLIDALKLAEGTNLASVMAWPRQLGVISARRRPGDPYLLWSLGPGDADTAPDPIPSWPRPACEFFNLCPLPKEDMATATRPYIVIGKEGAKRLIEAANQSQAVRHASRADYSVKAASASEVLELMRAGCKPETAIADEKDGEQ